MARPGRPERNRTARSFRQLRRFHHFINSDNVFGTHTRLSMSGFTKACVRRQRDDFRVRKSGCNRVANPRAPAGAIREAIAPYGRYNAASLPKVQSTGYLDTIQNKAAVALPAPMSAGSPGRPAKGLPKSGIDLNDVRVRSFVPNGAPNCRHSE